MTFLQYTIPFIESLMPPEIAGQYTRMKENLPDAGQLTRENTLPAARDAMRTVLLSMEFLKNYCEKVSFDDRNAEIIFFKVIKPNFHKYLIYWKAVFDLELHRPAGGVKREMKFLKKSLDLIYHFFESHSEFYRYYRSGQTDRDAVYFLRKPSETSLPLSPDLVDANPAFAAGHDRLLAELMANDMICQYLINELSLLRRQKSDHPMPASAHRLQWTASRTALVELIYALQTGGVFNDGRAAIKEIATIFQENFGVDLANFYHTFNEIRLRKKNRTSLLDRLREKVIQKMDSLDEN